MMKFLMTLALALLTFIPVTQAMQDTKSVSVVMFHADNCGACKILAPKMEEALNQADQTKLDVVKFDFSNRQTIEETKALAEAKGLNSTLQTYGAKTGFAVLVDSDGNILETIKFNDDVDEISAKLAKAIG
jgi:thiol-disulfide isomerase/thioredoxin